MTTKTKARTTRKTPTKAKAKPEPKTEAEPTAIAKAFADRRTTYTKAKTPAGKATLHNGDDVALMLAGCDLNEVYEIAAERLGVTFDELDAKYGHLNLGMQRMNLGNRIRGALKKAKATDEAA